MRFRFASEPLTRVKGGLCTLVGLDPGDVRRVCVGGFSFELPRQTVSELLVCRYPCRHEVDPAPG